MKRRLENLTWLKSSQSQIGQESFVFWILDSKRSGFFLEIGAYHSKLLSNTYALEKDFEWQGIGIEIDDLRCQEYNDNRKSKCIRGSAIEANYEVLLDQHKAPNVIDFLQIDIEPPHNSFLALKKVLKSSRRFKVVTFEHDIYANWFNRIWQVLAFVFLFRSGYRRVVKNVCNGSAKQEDWYVASEISDSVKKRKNLDFREIFDCFNI